jgi:hypothetical protein
MPGKLATLVELFGYKGDRMFGLKMLMRTGGWGEGERMVEACKCFSFCSFENTISDGGCS